MKYFALLPLLFSSLYVSPQEGHAQMISWEQTNGPFGGDGLCLAVDSTDWVLLGTTKGVYGLPAVGGYWTSLGLEQYSVQSLAVHNSGAILAASSAGMFTTTDHGSTWGVSDLTVSVSLVASSPDGFVYAVGSGDGIYRSDDIGVHWVEVRDGQHMGLAVNSAGNVFALDYREITRSTDHGDTWESLSLNVSGLATSLCVLPDNSLGVGTFDTNCPDPPHPCGSNAGIYWLPEWGDSLMSVVYGWNVFNLLATSTEGMFVVSDYGSLGLFNQMDSTVTYFQMYEVNTAIELAEDLFIAGRTGLGTFTSWDAGLNWFETNGGLKNSTVTSLFAIDSVTLLAGSFPRLWRSTNQGDLWNPVLDVAGYGQCHMLASAGTSLYSGVGDYGVYESTNAGLSWIRKGFNAGGVDLIGARVYSFLKVGGDSLLAGAFQWGFHGKTDRGIFLSEDNGGSWEKIGMEEMTPRSLALDSTGVVVAGTWANGIYRSTDQGTTWVYSGAGSASIASVLVTDENVVLAATDGDGIFRSVNSGAEWSPVNLGLTTLRISSLEINSEGEIFAASFDQGIFISSDDGLSWSESATGLTNSAVLSMAIGDDGHAYVGTDGSGVFRTTSPTTSVQDPEKATPGEFLLMQNYPNPFNGLSNFEFRLPAGQAGIAHLGYVTLKVYDLLGREVATIVNEKLGAGTYTRQWDAAGLASGVYVYRLNVGEFVESRKLVLIR